MPELDQPKTNKNDPESQIIRTFTALSEGTETTIAAESNESTEEDVEQPEFGAGKFMGIGQTRILSVKHALKNFYDSNVDLQKKKLRKRLSRTRSRILKNKRKH